MVTQAVIIAAGNGNRPQSHSAQGPASLLTAAGVPLIKRVVLAAQQAGIERCLIVLGYQGDKVRACLTQDPEITVQLEWIYNPDWAETSRGISLLKAEEKIEGPFVLLTADHLFDYRTLVELLKQPLQEDECILCVDRKLDTLYDLADAIKVSTRNGLICDLDKGLVEFDGVDTGIFLCTPTLFRALEESRRSGDCLLTDANKVLAREGRLRYYDIGAAYWQDINSPAALRQAEKLLLKSARKVTDGVISRFINRPISVTISKLLVKTPVTPNQVTIITFLIGLSSAFLVSLGDYWNVLWGALLFQLASITDGCDGELAKLKMMESSQGAWLDTITDNLTYLTFGFGVMVGFYRQSQSPLVLGVGLITLVNLLLVLGMIYYYLIKKGTSGSLLAFYSAFEQQHGGSQGRGILGLMDRVKFMLKRDFFAFLFLFVAVLGKLNLIFWLLTLGIGGMVVGVALSLQQLSDPVKERGEQRAGRQLDIELQALRENGTKTMEIQG